jgi:plasmid stability protein
MDDELIARARRLLGAGEPRPVPEGAGGPLDWLAQAQAVASQAREAGEMRQLAVNIEVELVAALERCAARNGRTLEAEHQAILREVVVQESPSLKELLVDMPDVGEDDDFAVERDLPRDVRG